MSCGVGHRRGLDLLLLWPWHRLVAIALLQPLAWEPPYAAGVALEKTHTHTQKSKEKKRNGDQRKNEIGKKPI